MGRATRSVLGVMAAGTVWMSAGCATHCGKPADAGASDARAFEADASAGVQHMEFLDAYAATYRFRLGGPSSIRVMPDGESVLFLRGGARSFVNDLYEFDVKTGQERVLLTAEQILQGGEEELSAEEKARRERLRLAARGIAGYSVSEDGTKILVPLSGRLFVVDRATRGVKELKSEAGYPLDARFSKDGSRVGVVRDGDLYVMDAASGEERRLTTRTSDTQTNGLAEFVAQEEMDRHAGYWWSPDGEWIAYAQADTAGMQVFTIMDPTEPSKPAQTWAYPRAGEKNAEVRLGVTRAWGNGHGSAGHETVWVEWDRAAWPYLATVKWEENAPLTILVQNRAQTEEVLYAVEPATGALKELLREKDKGWVNLDQAFPKWINDGQEFLWSTERDGWWTLEVRGKDGAFRRALCGQEINYRGGVIGVDEEAGVAYVAGAEDPTQTMVYRVPLAGGEAQQFTWKSGSNGMVLEKGTKTRVMTHEGPDGTATWSVVRADGSNAGLLRSEREKPGFGLRTEYTSVRANGVEMHAAISRPSMFREGMKYPVIVSVYGGPHAQVVTRNGSRHYFNQWLAEQGFVVVAVDGRGTPSRGRDWERAIKHDLIEIPLADQKAALKALGAKYREMDLSRVGIYGWSFGGYFSAMGVMREGEVFHAGVAGAPVADWRDYDTHYTERYMGMPQENTQGYDAANVLTWAEGLERPLLIVHGTADDNVYFMHALKMSDSLFKAGKRHEFLALAGFTHMVPDPVVTRALYGRIAGFFLRELGGPQGAN